MNDLMSGVSAATEPTVGARINWGAVLGGSVIAFGFYLLFVSLGAAVGLTISEHVSASNLHVAVVAWAFVSTAGAFFVGGLVTSLLTTGEKRIEAILHGVVTWAIVVALMIGLGAAGTRTGFTAMTAMAHGTPNQSWETAAREAGVAPEQLDSLRRSMSIAGQKAQDPSNQQELKDAARRVGWYAFAGIWGSMLAAALGAILGAGRAFRVIPAGTLQLIQTRPA